MYSQISGNSHCKADTGFHDDGGNTAIKLGLVQQDFAILHGRETA